MYVCTRFNFRYAFSYLTIISYCVGQTVVVDISIRCHMHRSLIAYFQISTNASIHTAIDVAIYVSTIMAPTHVLVRKTLDYVSPTMGSLVRKVSVHV